MPLPLEISDLQVVSDRGRVLVAIERLSLSPGQALGLRGPSGAGKSTALMAMAGLAPQAKGSVRWGDTDLLTLSEPARARFRRDHIGLIFQDFLLFEELGAAANASVSALYAPRDQRDTLRAAAGAELRALGLGSAMGQAVPTLSGGERQRVAVARALATAPQVLLADEPTANLDRPNADRLIADLMARVQDGGQTLVAVSHDPALLDAMDQVLELADGRVVEAA